MNGTCFFWANDGVNETALWKSDGTATGTVLAYDFIQGVSSNPFPFTNVNGTWFFAAHPGLWKFVAGSTAVGNDHWPIPASSALHQNYSNPFNPTTEIKFDLPEVGDVSLAVFDVLGRKVAELVDGYRAAGYHSVTWHATGVASGVYFARFMASDESGKVKFSKMNKLILMK